MRSFHLLVPIALLSFSPGMVVAKENVAFFGLVNREDPLLASFFSDRVYRAMLTDTLLVPVSPERWEPWAREWPHATESPRVEPFQRLAKNSKADFFVMAYAEPFQYVSHRIWWKPWGRTTRMFHSLRIQVFKTDSSSVYDGVVAFEDSLKRNTLWSYQPATHDDPALFDSWRREVYADLANPVVRAIRAALSGKPQPSAVFVKEPPKADKGKKKKKK